MRNAYEFRQEDLVLIICTCLNNHYAVICSQILIMESFPNANDTFGMIIQRECLNELDFSDDSPAILNLSDAKRISNNWKGKSSSTNKVCIHCRRRNHTADVCFQKHGYPSGFKSKECYAKSYTDDTDKWISTPLLSRNPYLFCVQGSSLS